MQQLLKWTLESIRSDEAMMSWLEEQRFEWTAAAAQAIKQMLAHHLLNITYRGEIEGFVPTRDELYIMDQLLLYRYRKVQAHLSQAKF